MFNFFSTIKRWRLKQSFRRAYTIALESRNNQERIAAAKYALEIVNYIQPWSISQVSRKRAIGKLHGSLARVYYNLIPENPPYFSQLAIEESHRSLEYLTPEDGLEWALCMNNLSIIYADSVLGGHGENLEKAIRAAESALSVIESEKDPLWFKAMANLGNYYNERQQGNPYENLEKSTQIFEEILRKRGDDLPPIDVASTIVSIANCYFKDRSHNRRQKIEDAIELLEKAIRSFSFAEAPSLWAMAHGNLTAIYMERIGGEKDENIKLAFEAIAKSLDAFVKIGDQESWAHGKLMQARIWKECSYGNRNLNFKKALSAVEEALEIYSPEYYPEKRIKAILLLSEVKRLRENKGRRIDIETSIVQVEKALISNTVQNDLQLLTLTLQELGDLYAERIEGNPVGNIEKSIEFLERNVQLIDQGSYPIQWGMALNKLAQSYHSRVKGLRADNMEMLIALCEQAIFVIPHWNYPDQHAHVLETLGEGYRERLRGDRKENLILAKQIFTAAANYRDKDQNPEAWLRLEEKYLMAERTWASLDLTETERKDAFVYDTEKYFSTLHENAEIVLAEEHPRTWIHAQTFLGDAYTRLTPIDTNFNNIERAFEDFLTNLEKAVKIYESTLPVAKNLGDDFEWAIIQQRIGNAHGLMYLSLQQLLKFKGHDEKDIKDHERIQRCYKLGVVAFEKSLAICTCEQRPRSHLSTAVNLGRFHADQEKWLKAESLFASASKAADQILGTLEISESDAIAILSDLGQMASLAPYVALMLNQPLRAIELSERMRARLLAKALTLDSLPLPDTVRNEIHTKQSEVAVLEKKLLSPRLFNRKAPLERSMKLRNEIRDLIGPIDLDESLDNIEELLANIVKDHTVVVLPLMTSEQGNLIIIHHDNGSAKMDVFKCPSLDAVKKILGPSDTQKLAIVAKNQNRTKGGFEELVTKVGMALGEIFATPLVNALESLGIEQGRHIDIVLQGSLGVLPLGLAYVENTGKILLEHYEISMSPSIRVLNHVRERKNLVSKSIAALANPDQTLRYAEMETGILRKWFPVDDDQNKYIEGRPIKADELLRELSSKDIWHFATHGGFDAKTPKKSALKLSKTDVLTLEKLLERTDLGSPRLVILSACETGLYDLKALPNEFIGLPSGFLQVGAAGVISTLWSVGDQSTALLMRKFYDAYMGGELSPSAALREAQLWLKTATSEDIIQAINQWEVEKSNSTIRLELEQVKNQLMTETRGLGRLNSNKTRRYPYASPWFWGGFVHYGV